MQDAEPDARPGVLLWISCEQPRAENPPQHEIEAADRQIDQLVYGLYGLTDKQIKIVEEATRGREKGTRTFSDALNARLFWVRRAGEG